MDSVDTKNIEKTKLNQIQATCEIKNIKNNNNLKQIFSYLNKLNLLAINRYCKNIQKRINLSINDYKEYSEAYSSIEIEIIPLENGYGPFINCPNDEERYQIYFNNNKHKKIKKHIIFVDENIDNILVLINKEVNSFYKLFYDCKSIKSINFKKFARNNIENMSKMFKDCTNLEEIKFSYANTLNVLDMSYMFNGCKSLKRVNLSYFNTSNVIDMSCMFYGCESIEEINLSKFNTNNVGNMSCMFGLCSSLKTLNISGLNTNNVTDMRGMFIKCSSLEKLDLSNFNINKDTSKFGMFAGCPDELNKTIKALKKNLI